MRLAFVVYGSLDNVSGGFIYDRALVHALRARGHDVDVIALPWRTHLHAAARNLLARSPRAEGPLYDVVIQDELVHPSLFLVNHTPARARLRLALVHNLRCLQPRERFPALKTLVERRYFSTVDGVLAVCERTLADVRTLTATTLPSLVIPPGRDHLLDAAADDPTAPLPDPLPAKQGEGERDADAPRPLGVLHLAPVLPHKGLPRLLDALALALATSGEAARVDFTLHVVGSLSSRRTVRAIWRRAARLGLTSRLQMHGERTGVELRALFRRCDVLALPSDREAYSLACLEALGFGLPVLATSRGGLDEMITHGREGFLLDPDDTNAWARALTQLARDRATRAAMSRAALARHRAHATWREVAAAVERFITERLEKSAPPERPAAAARR